MCASNAKTSTCERLREIREEVFGRRGRAAFARELGLSPSTYIYYEKGREPPADVLVRASRVTGARLEWLLTGEGPKSQAAEGPPGQAVDEAVPADLRGALVERFRRAVAEKPDADAATRALADVLEKMGREFPAEKPRLWQKCRLESCDCLIPILGRSAAGLVASWQECFGEAEDRGPALSDLADAVTRADVHTKNASGMEQESLAAGPDIQAPPRLVQLSEPLESGVVEFIESRAIRAALPRAFAVRVDGESMAPRFRHGDILITSPDVPLRQGQAAVVQVKGKIGAGVKLYRREGNAVHLIPINEKYETVTVPASRVEWAVPVVYCIRV